MASTDKNASLFGDDSDSSSSSDESVGRGRTAEEPNASASAKASANASADAGGGGNVDGDGHPGTAGATTNDADDVGDVEKKVDGSEKKDDDDGGEDAAPTAERDDEPNPPPAGGKHASLFGDDDDGDSSSSADDEFDGDDGIVGRAAEGAPPAAAVAAAERAPRTMNQTLGLDSDSDDDRDAGRDQSTKDTAAAPAPRPPRRMQLLSLADEATRRDNVFHVAKLPNLVGINVAPYDARTHDKEAEEEYYRGYVHNMIRWRYRYRRNDERELLRDADGNPVRESNTRLVKWSDGSYTLHVGREVLEVDSLDSTVPATAATGHGPGGAHPLPGFAGINGYLYVSQQATVRPPSKRDANDENGPSSSSDNDNDDDGNGNGKPAGTILECLGPIASRFAPRPSSLASEAHRNLTLAVRQRNVKRARIAEIVTEVDPEKEKLARIKGKDDLEKSKRGRMGGGRRSGGGRRGHGRGMNAKYLEEEDGDYDGVNLGRLKRQTMRRDVYSDEEDVEMDYGEDSEEEEDEWSKNKKKRPNRNKGRGGEKGSGGVGDRGGRREEEEEEGELVFGDDDDEGDDAAMFKKRGGGAASKKAVLDDDDD
ncbi:hypothetical protein ACHAXS_011058 [Conticribra weissflogii]